MPAENVGQKLGVIIDAHVHLYPPEVGHDPKGWAERTGEHQWAQMCVRQRRDGRPVQTFPTVEELLRTMDAAGIDRAVLLGWYWEHPSAAAAQNRFHAECIRQYPDRLSAFATFHPAAGHDAVLDEIRRARADGLVGLGELSPHSQGYAIDDPTFAAVLTLAGESGMPVNLHVTDPAGRSYPGRVETPLEDFVRLARIFPKTKFILAHWGGMLPLVIPEAGGTALPNVFYDTAASPLLYDSAVWPQALPRFGLGRVIFGSDYPLNLYPKVEALPEMSRLLAEARAGGADSDVLGGNALRLLAGVGTIA